MTLEQVFIILAIVVFTLLFTVVMAVATGVFFLRKKLKRIGKYKNLSMTALPVLTQGLRTVRNRRRHR